MAPIRVGFIGLSKSGWAPGAHLPYLKESGKYEIVAIQNSSVESSKEAIKLYNLPSTTKAYGKPEDIAQDKDIELVVCSVRVDRHFPAVAPSLKAGKDVFVEWPLGKNLAEAEEMLRLKNEGRVKRAVVGLQGRQAPILNTLRELIEGGKVGKVLSSTWLGQAGTGGPTIEKNYEYLCDRQVGGNLVSIHFGHAIDSVQAVLGFGFKEHPKTLLANRRPFVQLLEDGGKTVIAEKHPKTSDDTVFLLGTLSTGIPLSFSLRGGTPFKNTPGLEWRIYGEKGEFRITASGPFLQIGYPDLKIEIHDIEKDTVEEIPVPTDEFDKFGLPARNVARLYAELAEGKIKCSFEDAVERHRLIDQIQKENGIKV